jgi:hypothetical protein
VDAQGVMQQLRSTDLGSRRGAAPTRSATAGVFTQPRPDSDFLAALAHLRYSAHSGSQAALSACRKSAISDQSAPQQKRMLGADLSLRS